MPIGVLAQVQEISLFVETPPSPAQEVYINVLSEALIENGFSVPSAEPIPVGPQEGRAAVADTPGAIGLTFLRSDLQTADLAATLLSAPGAFNDPEAYRAAQRGLVGDRARDEIHADGAIALRLWSHSANTLASTFQLATVDDFAGLATATSDPLSSVFLESLGASPRSLAFADVFVSVSTGATDTAVLPQVLLNEDTLEVFSEGSVLSSYQINTAATWVSESWWRSLTLSQQRRLGRALDAAEIAAADQLETEAGALSEIAASSGLTVVSWQDYSVEGVQSAVLTSVATNLGIDDAQPVLDLLAATGAAPLPPPNLEEQNGLDDDGMLPTPARVFFASNRRFDPGEAFLADRFASSEDPNDSIRCGEFVPAEPARVGDVREPIALLDGAIDQDEVCIGRILDAVGSQSGHLTIYVHGYRNSFENAAETALAFARDTGTTSTVLTWSWPSDAEFVSYLYDEESVTLSVPPFLEFISAIAQSPDVTRIDFVGHSMGTRLLAHLMREEWIDQPSTVVFASADLTWRFMEQALAEATNAEVALYVTEHDRALQASEGIHRRPRAGRADPLFLNLSADTIDLSEFDRWAIWWVNHGHAFSQAEVVHDIARFLSGDGPAEERGLESVLDGASNVTYFRISPHDD